MKYRTRLLSLLLAGVMVLSLAACTGGQDANADPTPPSDTAEPSSDSVLPEDFVADTSVDDLCLATADIPGNFELLTVNGIPVTARAYLYWLMYNISSLSSAYGAIDWSTTSSDSDYAPADYIKEISLNTVAYYTLVTAKAKELGFDMTQEQTDELDSTFEFTIAMLGGEEAFENELRKVGLDSDTLYQINAAPYYYEQLTNGLYDEPTAEEMNKYIEENDILSAKHILLATVDLTTGEPLDEAAIAEKRATAEDLLSQLQASSDLTADFDTLMNEYSEDTGLAYYPDGYTFTSEDNFDESFEAATRELEFGQISGLVESSFGYHIILRLDPDTATARQEYRADQLDAQIMAWLDEADIVFTDEYESLNPQLFYEKFTAYQEAFAAEAAAETEPESSTDSAAESSPDSSEN